MSATLAPTASAVSEESYDEVPYPGGAFRPSHPSHLAMVARLCGLTPVPPKRCRVLELGCSMGANLIPMAQDAPDSEFVGIDLSARQIEEGRAAVDELELTNIELRHLSILDVHETLGKFDYIICHGVYSWVPADVQRKILTIGRDNMTSNGLLYVSYNTYPGWHLRGVVREMMRYHVADFETPQMQIRQARGLLDFLVKNAKTSSQAYPQLLKDEAKMLESSLDSYIYHEHLEEFNEPLYFHQFVKRVDEAGLRYMADAHISSMVAQLFDESAAEILKDVPLLRREQYMDFLRSRMFRSSILCHPSQVPDYSLSSGNLVYLHVSLNQAMQASQKPSGEIVWQHASGTLTTEMPVTAAISTLQQKFPAWVAVQDLLNAVPDHSKRAVVLDALLMGFVRGVFRFAEDPVNIPEQVSDKPECSRHARYQARKGTRVTGQFHYDWVVQPQQRFLIEHCDGTRTAEDLAELLRAQVTNGRFKVTKEGQMFAPDMDESLKIVREELQRMRVLGVLVS